MKTFFKRKKATSFIDIVFLICIACSNLLAQNIILSYPLGRKLISRQGYRGLTAMDSNDRGCSARVSNRFLV